MSGRCLPRKVWRDAASLILTARKPPGSVVQSPGTTTEVGEEEKVMRDYFDYQTLMLKRSSKSKFMPNAFVFPGGVLSETDTSQEWVELLRLLGHGQDDLEELVLKDVDRPFLMSRADVTEGVARDIALR